MRKRYVIANAQRSGGLAAFIDAEHALDPGYAKRLGVNLNDLLVSQPDSGEEALSVANVVFASATINVSRYAGVAGVDDPDDTLAKKLKGDLLAVSISHATLFIGNGASLDLSTGVVTLPDINDTTAVGFRVSNGSLNLGIFTASASSTDGTAPYTALAAVRKYTGLEAGLGVAALQGVSAVQLIATDLIFKQNTSSVVNGGL